MIFILVGIYGKFNVQLITMNIDIDIDIDNSEQCLKTPSVMKLIRNAIMNKDYDTYNQLLIDNPDTTSKSECVCGNHTTDNIMVMLQNDFGYYEKIVWEMADLNHHIENHILYSEVSDEKSLSHAIYFMFLVFNGEHNTFIGKSYDTNILETTKYLLDHLGHTSFDDHQQNCLQDFYWIGMSRSQYRNSNRYDYGNAPKIINANIITLLLGGWCTERYSMICQKLIYLLVENGVDLPEYIAYWRETDEIIGPNSDYDPETCDNIKKMKLEYRSSYQHMVSRGMVYLLRNLFERKEHMEQIINMCYGDYNKYVNEFSKWLDDKKKEEYTSWDHPEPDGRSMYEVKYPDGDSILNDMKEFIETRVLMETIF